MSDVTVTDRAISSKLIISVSADVYANGISQAHKLRNTTWESQYDVATWLKSPSSPKKTVELLMIFADDLGKHRIKIDRALTNQAGEIMLSGVVGVKAQGPISSMEIYVRGPIPSNHYIVEDVFVQRKKAKGAEQGRSTGRNKAPVL